MTPTKPPLSFASMPLVVTLLLVGAVPGLAEPSDAAPTRPETDLAGVSIEGPPPPAPPAVINRDERGRVTLRATRTDEPVVIDGRLDERVYREVQAVGGFIQQDPIEGVPATEKTDVWILFDNENVYISARCWDSHPERLVVTETRRDNQGIFNNDQFTVVIDTFYDRRTGYLFTTNALGARRDQQINSSSNLNLDWNPVWDAMGRRDAEGWTAEMAIPFKSLRFKGSGPQVWGINFRRPLRWKNEWDFLTPVPRSYGSSALHYMNLAATLVGIEVPAQRNLELKPYAISSLTTNRAVQPVVSNDKDGNLGFDAKYGLTRSLMADFTYNTDFAQVEEDSQQVNLTRFSLFFPEKRDFFLEGQGIFSFGPGNPFPVVFFSRQIGLNNGATVPIETGARLTGRTGRYTLGVLDIQTKRLDSASAPSTNFSTIRIKRDILRRSTVGFIATSRSRRALGDGSNQVVGGDVSLGLYENVAINGYYARSLAPGSSGDNASYYGSASYSADRYGLSLNHGVVEERFSPELGFLYRTGGFRRTYAEARFSPRLKRGPVRKLYYQTNVEYITGPRGGLETRTAEASFRTQFNSGDDWTTEYSSYYDRLKVDFPIATGVTITAGAYAYQNLRTQYTFGVQRKLSGTVQFNRGTFYDGTKTALGLSSGRVDIIRRFSVEPGVSLNRVETPHGDFTASVVSARATYMPTARANASTFVQYNSASHLMSASGRFRWEYVPGSELFVVYSDNRDARSPGFPALQNRTFAVKVTRLIRL